MAIVAAMVMVSNSDSDGDGNCTVTVTPTSNIANGNSHGNSSSKHQDENTELKATVSWHSVNESDVPAAGNGNSTIFSKWLMR